MQRARMLSTMKWGGVSRLGMKLIHSLDRELGQSAYNEWLLTGDLLGIPDCAIYKATAREAGGGREPKLL